MILCWLGQTYTKVEDSSVFSPEATSFIQESLRSFGQVDLLTLASLLNSHCYVDGLKKFFYS